jgi:hypothetical protein
MGTTYNNQWVLGRTRTRWRRRAGAAGTGGLGQPVDPLPPETHTHEPHAPASPVPPRPRAAFARPVRKRPRWIDRDT